MDDHARRPRLIYRIEGALIGYESAVVCDHTANFAVRSGLSSSASTPVNTWPEPGPPGRAVGAATNRAWVWPVVVTVRPGQAPRVPCVASSAVPARHVLSVRWVAHVHNLADMVKGVLSDAVGVSVSA